MAVLEKNENFLKGKMKERGESYIKAKLLRAKQLKLFLIVLPKSVLPLTQG